MLRPTVSRAVAQTNLLSSAVRSHTRPQCLSQATRSLTTAGGQSQQTRGQHAVSNPTLANIEKRWENMPPQEQAELWMALRDRMTVDWNQLTLQEKKASYYIAFGPHGPRSGPKPGEKIQVFKYVMICLVASSAVFAALRYGARPPPKTMSQEWQEATNEYLKAQNSEAITGVSADDYVGKGMVQSPPRGVDPDAEEE